MGTINVDEFLEMLAGYNQEIWPLQIMVYILGFLAVYTVFKPSKFSVRLTITLLAISWLWVGAMFCYKYWADIFAFASIFALIFIISGLLFIYAAVRNEFRFRFKKDWRSIIGLILIIYGLAGYQLLGYLTGHVYPQFFAFGLVPCPTTIFTIGLFMMTERRIPVFYLIGPILISTAGFKVVPLGIYEDIVLIIAGIFAVYLIFRPRRLQEES